MLAFSKINLAVAAFGAGMLTLTFGCGSKFAESSPESIKIQGIPLEQRLSEKNKVDARIEEIQSGADKVKKIIEMFKKIQNPTLNQDVYTPLDFVIDASNVLKEKIPLNQDNKLVRFATVTLPIDALSESCRTVETSLVSSYIYGSQPKQDPIGEKLTYSIKTCGSDGEFLEAITAEWVGTTLEFKLANKNLESIFKKILSTENLSTSTCKIKNGDKNIVESIICQNFEVDISVSEKAHIKNMAFKNNDDIRFETIADIFENNILKNQSEIKVLSNGSVKVEVKKVENQATTSH